MMEKLLYIKIYNLNINTKIIKNKLIFRHMHSSHTSTQTFQFFNP